MARIHTIGLDVSKNTFQIHAVDKKGVLISRRKLNRAEMEPYFRRLKPCVIGVEATGGVHYWGRRLSQMGHTVKLMPGAYVKAYVKTNKSDANDAEAICEAVGRPNMRFVPIKNEEQQSVLLLHRARSLLIHQRVMLTNAMRGLLSEFGIVVPRYEIGTKKILHLVDDMSPSDLPAIAVDGLKRLALQHRHLMTQIEHFDGLIERVSKSSAASRRLMSIPGVGVLVATAMVAAVGDGSQFRSGRHMAAWLGLVPRQESSGGKSKLKGMSKRGDPYLRRILFIGALSALRVARNSSPRLIRWAKGLTQRKPYKVAVVALCNKIVRVSWALLTKVEYFLDK